MNLASGRDVFEERINVSRETLQKLEFFVEQLGIWTKKINLIAPSTLPDVWVRHVLDSAQIYDLLEKKSLKTGDLGSGGGFPAMILAILASEREPESEFIMIESDKRKSAFLAKMLRDLGLNGQVMPMRSENAEALGADVVTSRAFTHLESLLPHLERHMKPTGSAILLKGSRALEEVTKARTGWNFTVEHFPSITDPTAKILVVNDIARKQP